MQVKRFTCFKLFVCLLSSLTTFSYESSGGCYSLCACGRPPWMNCVLSNIYAPFVQLPPRVRFQLTRFSPCLSGFNCGGAFLFCLECSMELSSLVGTEKLTAARQLSPPDGQEVTGSLYVTVCDLMAHRS